MDVKEVKIVREILDCDIELEVRHAVTGAGVQEPLFRDFLRVGEGPHKNDIDLLVKSMDQEMFADFRKIDFTL